MFILEVFMISVCAIPRGTEIDIKCDTTQIKNVVLCD